jgi:hypothetical protein
MRDRKPGCCGPDRYAPADATGSPSEGGGGGRGGGGGGGNGGTAATAGIGAGDPGIVGKSAGAAAAR